MLIAKVFDLLDDWKSLPAYQLERRADIFFALHLKLILEKKFQIEVDEEDIIPEFPVRKGSISGQAEKSNQSFKVDYLALSKNREFAFLIELKTDAGSWGESQYLNMMEASNIKLEGMIDGLIKIFPKTRKRAKYAYLLDKLEKMGLIKKENGEWVSVSPDIKPTIVYIMPQNEENDAHVISFNEIANMLRHEQDELTKRFVESLQKWGGVGQIAG